MSGEISDRRFRDQRFGRFAQVRYSECSNCRRACRVASGYPDSLFPLCYAYGVQLGYGYVMCQYQPSVYPDRPVNVFFTMDCAPEAEYLLFGALAARARQLREQYPGQPGRMYTSVTPGDVRKLSFLEHNGLTMGNSEDLVRLHIPADLHHIPHFPDGWTGSTAESAEKASCACP